MHLHRLRQSRVFHKLSNDHFLHNSVEPYNLLRPLRWFVQTRCIFLISPDHCTELHLIKSKNFIEKIVLFLTFTISTINSYLPTIFHVRSPFHPAFVPQRLICICNLNVNVNVHGSFWINSFFLFFSTPIKTRNKKIAFW